MILLAPASRGVRRAEGEPGGSWRVEHLLPEERITSLERDPFEARAVWAGSQTGAVLRSDDGGASWRTLGRAGSCVKSLAASRHAAGTLYAGTKPAGVAVSRDGGASWRDLSAFRRARRWFWMSPADPPGRQPYVLGLTVSPSDPRVILAGVEAGAVLRSADGGESWSGHLRRADRDCHDLRFHCRDGAWAYQAGGGGPALSRDGGRSWTHPTSGLQGRYCMACAADPQRPEVWYVAASPLLVWPHLTRFPTAHAPGHAHAGIYRASGGARWERLEGGLPQPLDHTPYTLLTDPDAPGHLYAGLHSGRVWHSADHGDSWRRLDLDLGESHPRMVML